MYYFLVNDSGGSGKTKKIWQDVKNVLESRGIGFKAFKTESDEHVRELSGKISSLKDDDDIRIVILGGDGTINNVLNGIKHFDRIKMGFLPTGSANDLVRGLSIPKDPLKALDDILDDTKERIIDLGKISWKDGERLFGISGGVGLDALVCKQALTSKLKPVLNKIGMGQSIYTLLTVKDLFTMKYMEGRITFKNGPVEQTVYLDKMVFAAFMNVKAEGGGVPMAPDAEYDDGLISTCALSGMPRHKSFFSFPKLLKGRQKEIKGFVLKDASEIHVKLSQDAVVHTDGEYVGELNEFGVYCIKEALKVIQ